MIILGTTSIIVSTLLEVSQSLARFYYWLRLTREVRCYCKDSLMIAQQLVVPLRVADLLIFIANSETVNHRFDDCQTKLYGLSDILCLSNNHPTPVKHQNVKKAQITVPEICIEDATEGSYIYVKKYYLFHSISVKCISHFASFVAD